MKLLILLFLFFPHTLAAQVLIHAHNDYEKKEPLINALKNKVYTIEADVYLVDGKLKVSHDKRDLDKAPALTYLYLDPIVDRFKKYNGFVSDDSSYTPVLMIDIKENGVAALDQLEKELSKHPAVFDRLTNPKAVQVVVSGDRGPIAEWTKRPSYILFDGRPKEQYDNATLKRVGFISDSYITYSIPPDNIDLRVSQLVQQVHNLNKKLRLWSAPDTPEWWERLQKLGVDIINTDKVEECRNYFKNQEPSSKIQKN
jgi:alkaline phosphatase